MIVRTWHGCVPEALGEAFAGHLRKTGEDHARRVPGNLGVSDLPFSHAELLLTPHFHRTMLYLLLYCRNACNVSTLTRTFARCSADY